MVRQGRKSTKKVKNLPAKSVSARQAKRVKGGGGVILERRGSNSANAPTAGLLLPAIQKVRE